LAKKDQKKKDQKKNKRDRLEEPSAEPGSASTYADGTALDRVQYLEAKLILKSDRFTSVQSFRDFGKIVQRTAKKTGVGFIGDPDAGLRPEIREILFSMSSQN
jgi:hypothetical protein